MYKRKEEAKRVNKIELPQRRTRSSIQQSNENIPEQSFDEVYHETPMKKTIRDNTPHKGLEFEQTELAYLTSDKKLTFTPRSIYESGKSLKSAKSGISSLLEENLTFSDDFEQPRDICISVNENTRIVNDLSRLRRQCIEQKIPFHFNRLVVKCRNAAGRFIPEVEVLVTLIRNEGRVKDTIIYYEQAQA